MASVTRIASQSRPAERGLTMNILLFLLPLFLGIAIGGKIQQFIDDDKETNIDVDYLGTKRCGVCGTALRQKGE